MDIDNRNLYRAEVSIAKKRSVFGKIIIAQPLSFIAIATVAGAFIILLGVFLFMGTYTRRSTVQGQLIPASGLIKVYVPQSGVVLEKHVSEGDHVEPGKILFVLSSEKQSSTQGNTQQVISANVELRRQSLADERRKTEKIFIEEKNSLGNKIIWLKKELENLNGQLVIQRNRAAYADELVNKYNGLLTKGYINIDNLQQKVQDSLDQKVRERGIERDIITLQRELNLEMGNVSSLSYRQQNQLAQIERNINLANQELTESEAKRGVVVVSSTSGIATAVIAEVGQAVDASRSLLSIVPVGATMRAQLYVPSRAIGFIKPGDSVLLRYQAYPYQKFGHAQGTVLSVSKTVLPSAELAYLDFLNNKGTAGVTESLYRVTVGLKSQEISANGISHSLAAGMLLEADVLLDTRKLYEWVLEPIYGMAGKI